VHAGEASLEGQRLELQGPGWHLKDVSCPLLGTFQPSNALLAAGAARCLGVEAGPIREGLAGARWPGRFQVLPGEPALVLDGAHNPGGARALAESLARYFPGEPVTFVVGISADKDAGGILAPLLPLAARIILTAASHPRAAAPAALAAFVPAGAASRVETASSPVEALALALGAPLSPVVCVAGSLFLIGEILARRPDAPAILCGIDGPD
jgi:dihydrofolate synthase/folylpolyglutamate synthase